VPEMAFYECMLVSAPLNLPAVLAPLPMLMPLSEKPPFPAAAYKEGGAMKKTEHRERRTSSQSHPSRLTPPHGSVFVVIGGLWMTAFFPLLTGSTSRWRSNIMDVGAE